MHRYKDFEVWKKAMDLSEVVYKMSDSFPIGERFGLTSQVRRSAVSVASNIAEGAGRNTNGVFRQFPGISAGSLFELETQLLLAERLSFIDNSA